MGRDVEYHPSRSLSYVLPFTICTNELENGVECTIRLLIIWTWWYHKYFLAGFKEVDKLGECPQMIGLNFNMKSCIFFHVRRTIKCSVYGKRINWIEIIHRVENRMYNSSESVVMNDLQWTMGCILKLCHSDSIMKYLFMLITQIVANMA